MKTNSMDRFLPWTCSTVSLQVNKLEQLDKAGDVTEGYWHWVLWHENNLVTVSGKLWELDKRQAELLWADIEAKGIENGNQKITEYVVSFVISAVAATFFFFVALTGLLIQLALRFYLCVVLTGWFIFQTGKNYILFMRGL